MKTFLMLISLVLSSIATDAYAVTGNDWRTLSKPSRDAFVLGVMESWLDLIVLADKGGRESNSAIVQQYRVVIDCSKGRPYSQTIAIVEKYMENNPSEWNSTMPSIVWEAIYESCPSKEKSSR